MSSFLRRFRVEHVLNFLDAQVFKVWQDVGSITAKRILVRRIISAWRWVFQVAVQLILESLRLSGRPNTCFRVPVLCQSEIVYEVKLTVLLKPNIGPLCPCWSPSTCQALDLPNDFQLQMGLHKLVNGILTYRGGFWSCASTWTCCHYRHRSFFVWVRIALVQGRSQILLASDETPVRRLVRTHLVNCVVWMTLFACCSWLWG